MFDGGFVKLANPLFRELLRRKDGSVSDAEPLGPKRSDDSISQVSANNSTILQIVHGHRSAAYPGIRVGGLVFDMSGPQPVQPVVGPLDGRVRPDGSRSHKLCRARRA